MGATCWSRTVYWARLPFWAACYFLHSKPLLKKLGNIDTTGLPGVFLGWHLNLGGKHIGSYIAAQLDDFRRLIAAGKPARVLVQQVKEVLPFP